MKLTDHVYLVGSGNLGFNLTDSLDCNVYLVDGGTELTLIDAGAGTGAGAIVEIVRSEGFDPASIRHIVLTHGHADHAGGASHLRRLLPGLSVFASSQISAYLRDGDEHALSVDVAKHAGIYPPTYTLEPCKIDIELEQGDVLQIGELTLKILDTPGHAEGHIALLLEESDGRQVLFAGDCVFFDGKIMLTTTHDCRLDALIESLRKLRELTVSTLLPGHFNMSLQDGQRHIERANQALDRLLLPEQAIIP